MNFNKSVLNVEFYLLFILILLFQILLINNVF